MRGRVLVLLVQVGVQRMEVHRRSKKLRWGCFVAAVHILSFVAGAFFF